jgi:hypothetical protein
MQGMKILVLTDSSANPRSFPASMVVQLEETYPYLLRKAFPQAVFYQLSFGNVTTEDLVSQAISYLTHWKPDFIVVQAGLSDCRPEAFSEAEKGVIKRLPERIFGTLKKNLYHPGLIRRRQLHRVSPDNFRKAAKKLKMIFAASKIFWLEICAATEYEQERPGVGARIVQYNGILEEIYGSGVIRLQEELLRVDGFNRDCIHWVKAAHQVAAERLVRCISESLPAERRKVPA